MRFATFYLALALSAAAAPHTEAAFAAFFDTVVPDTLSRYHVPGAVVAVVQDGAVVFAKGYGVSEVESAESIDPAHTLFRVASVSKLITATAVMQLVEAGKVDLDADVNTYLDGAWVPDFDGAPLSLRQLLTHTAGFDDRFLGMAAQRAEELGDLGAYLRDRLPPRVMPPASAISYSNHGVALAGLVVEEVSGQAFTDYVQQHIFDPLDMTRATFHLPPDRIAEAATGYDYRHGTYRPAPFDYPRTPPASSLTAPAVDMARFMIAHLEHDPALMQAESYRSMHQSPFRHHPNMPGRSIGFGEAEYNGQRVIQHTGLLWGFSSLCMLLPDDGTGLFVSVTTDATGAYGRIRGQFLDRFFPDPRSPVIAPAVPDGSAARVAQAAGSYLHNRRVRSTFLKFGTVAPQFAEEIQVRAGDAPGEIRVTWPRTNYAPRVYTEVEPWYFRDVVRTKEGARVIRPGARKLAFIVSDDGTPTHVAMGASAYDRIPWYQAGNLLLGCLAAGVLVLSAHPVVMLIRGWRGRKQGADRSLRALRCAVSLSAALLLCFLAGLGVVMLRLEHYAIGYGPPPYLPSLLALPLLALPCAVVAALLVPIARRRNQGTSGARIYYGFITTVVFIVLALLSYWNLLGYRYG